MVQTLSVIANKLLNNDPIQTEIYFLEYGLEDLMDIMIDNIFKRNEMVFLLYCFVQKTTNSHLRVLNKIREKISVKHRDAYYYILSRLILYEKEDENEDMSPEIFEFYIRDASQGIYCTSVITRTKSVSILSYLSRIGLNRVLEFLPILQKQCKDIYWEL